jgi:tRNA (guanine37-N1)-methyltransferase
MVVTLRESNAKFTFNFRDVYWNSRLQHEHDRMIELISDSYPSTSKSIGKPVIADMMAGVGPFAVPLAMTKKFHVHANGMV